MEHLRHPLDVAGCGQFLESQVADLLAGLVTAQVAVEGLAELHLPPRRHLDAFEQSLVRFQLRHGAVPVQSGGAS